MGWGDVRYCFAMAILVLIIIFPHKFFPKSPFFYFHDNCGKACPTDCDFLAYLIQLDVDVTGNITAKLCEVGSEFNIVCTLVPMATTAILMGWGDVRYCFAMAIPVLIIILPHIFVRSISRRCLDQTL
jgi:hypothetical protein